MQDETPKIEKKGRTQMDYGDVHVQLLRFIIKINYFQFKPSLEMSTAWSIVSKYNSEQRM